MWKSHFESLYNVIYDETLKMSFFDRCCNMTDNFNVTVDDEVRAMTGQKKGKAIGPDQFVIEPFMFGTHQLLDYVTMLFNACRKYCYLPPALMQSFIVLRQK